MLARYFGLTRHIDARDENLSFTRPQQAAQHADDCGFACPIGSDESHDLACGDRKVDMIYRDEGAEALGQRPGDN